MQKAVSRGCGTLFFSVFLLAGLAVTGLFLWSFVQTIRPYFWKETPCTIVESRRGTTELEKTSKSEGAIVIRYRYNFDGSDYPSDRRSMGMTKSLNQREIERLLAKYPQGGRAVCYVNGSHPEQAVLIRGSLWPILFIFLPLIFVAVGAFGIVGTWFPKALKAKPAKRTGGSKQVGVIKPLVVSGLIALFGGILTYVVGVRPLVNYFDAKHWPEVSCEILSSSVGRHSGSKGGTTYSVDITYRYQIDGREFQSDTYGLMTGSSSGYAAKAKVVSRYPVGSRAICYVNPRDSTEALLNRELSWWLLIALIPAVFLLIGVIGLGSSLRPLMQFNRGLTQPVLPGASNVISSPVAPVEAGPVVLRSTASPLAKFGGAIFIAVFWNGITGIFVGFAVKSWLGGKPEWFLNVFLIPFVLIGLVLIGYVGVTFLGLFNPRLRLTVNSRAVPLGGTIDVSWVLSGAVSRIQRFKLVLEGREEATYRRGTNTSTDKSVFASVVMIDTSDSHQIGQGNARAEIPPNLMHSWTASHNKIVWTLKAVGDIPRYPDVEEEFEFTVLARSLR